MNKKMVLMAVLLVNVVVAVFGTDFEERISRKVWLRDYFNEVVYVQDRNIIIEYQPKLTKKEKISFYADWYDDMIFWFEEPPYYLDSIECYILRDGGYYLSIFTGGFRYKAVRELTPDLYEVQIEDVRISQERYESLLVEDGKTLYATYCAYDGLEEEEALYEAIKTNEFDMTKITFPRHADGTCDYESGGGVPGKKIVNGVYRAQDNLRLRETGSTSGKAITTMQAGTYVRILSLGKEETIDGITDNWVEVETQFGAKNLEGDFLYGKTGWCFGGYLK